MCKFTHWSPKVHMLANRDAKAISTESTKLKKAAGDAFWAAVDFLFLLPEGWSISGGLFIIFWEIYKFYPWETCAIFAEFAKMIPLFWKCVFFIYFYWILWEIYKFYPWETCVIFAEFTKMTSFLWKCVEFVCFLLTFSEFVRFSLKLNEFLVEI